MISDKDLTRDLIKNGAKIGDKEIQLAANYGRASVLKILLESQGNYDKSNIVPVSSCSLAGLFWAPLQNKIGYEADYVKVQSLLM